MDLLSMIGMATKRRGDYFAQAETLAKKSKNQEDLEQKMAQESKLIVKGFRDKQMRWDEFERTMLDKTLVSALAAVYLGSDKADPKSKMEKAWPAIVGDMLPPLTTFMDEVKDYIDQSILKIGDQTEDFADTDWNAYFDNDFELDDVLTDPEDPSKYQINDPAAKASQVASTPGGVGRTWKGVVSRVLRYLSTPTFGFFNLGRFMRKQEQGFKEMRRVARKDKRTCIDCINYDEQGWQPIGSLPMPGHGCRCYDRCRCHIEYR
jgi:hypothetical protein